MLKIKLQI